MVYGTGFEIRGSKDEGSNPSPFVFKFAIKIVLKANCCLKSIPVLVNNE